MIMNLASMIACQTATRVATNTVLQSTATTQRIMQEQQRRKQKKPAVEKPEERRDYGTRDEYEAFLNAVIDTISSQKGERK